MTDSPVLTWIDPDDVEWQLMSGPIGRRLLRGVQGLGSFDVDIATDDSALGGTVVRGVYRQPRQIVLPQRITGPDHATHVARMRETIQYLGVTDEGVAGKLRVYRPDGTRREIPGFFRGGIPDMAWRWDNTATAIYCPNPAFVDVDETVETRAFLSGSAVPFLAPYPTVSLANLLGTSTVVNTGNLTAWPVWTITGPASGITLENLTTGEGFTIDPALDTGNILAGQSVTITTSPPTVRGPAGQIWTKTLIWPGAVLWGFKRGTNDVNFSITGAGVGTSLTLSYKRQWRSA